MHTAEAGLKETDVSNGIANQRTPSHLGFRRLCTSPASQDDRSPQPLGPAAGVVLPCPFLRGSFCHVSCTCEDRCPCPRVFTHITVYVGFQICSLESRPSNNSNTNKRKRRQQQQQTCILEQISQSEAFLRSSHTHSPADTQPCPSRVLGTHLLGPGDRGLPGARVPVRRMPWPAERPWQRGHVPGAVPARQLASLARSRLHDVPCGWNAFSLSAGL